MKTLILLMTYFAVTIAAQAEDLAPWQGRWSGTCTPLNYASSTELKPYPMALNISKKTTTTHSWQIQYPPQGPRNYTMIKQSDLQGKYVLDEHNGLLIDRFLINRNMTDLYTINGRIFNNSTTLNESGSMITMNIIIGTNKNGLRSTKSDNPIAIDCYGVTQMLMA